MAIAGILELQLLADMARLSTDMKRAERVVQDSTDKMGKSVATLEAAFGKLGSTLAFGVMFDQVRRMTDDYTKLTAQLRIATRSQEEYNRGMSDVRRISSEAQASITATTMLYTRLTNSLGQYHVSAKQVANITESVSLGLKAYGATSAEAASAMLQLSQAFGSNRLGGEEFRAVSEAMPNMMKVLADSMGVPLGALKQLSAEGKITSAEMAKAWSDPATIAALKKQADMTRTITGEIVVLQNELKILVGKFMESTGSTNILVVSIHAVSESVKFLSENITAVTSALWVGIKVWAAYHVAVNIAGLALLRNYLASAAVGMYMLTTATAAGTAGVTLMSRAVALLGLGLKTLAWPVAVTYAVIEFGTYIFETFKGARLMVIELIANFKRLGEYMAHPIDSSANNAAHQRRMKQIQDEVDAVWAMENPATRTQLNRSGAQMAATFPTTPTTGTASIGIFGAMATQLQEKIAADKAQLSNLQRVNIAYDEMNQKIAIAHGNTKQLAQIAHQYGTQQDYILARTRAIAVDDMVAAEKVTAKNKEIEKSIEAINKERFALVHSKAEVAAFDAAQLDNQLQQLAIQKMLANGDKERLAIEKQMSLLRGEQAAQQALSLERATTQQQTNMRQAITPAINDAFKTTIKDMGRDWRDMTKSMSQTYQDKVIALMVDNVAKEFATWLVSNNILFAQKMADQTKVTAEQMANANIIVALIMASITLMAEQIAAMGAAGREMGKSTTLTGTSQGATAGSTNVLMQRDMTWFQAQQNWSVQTNMSTQQLNMYSASIRESRQAMIAAGDTLGFVGTAAKTFSISLNTIYDPITMLSRSIGNSLIPAIVLFQKEGETLTQTAQRLTDAFKATNALLSATGTSAQQAFGGMGLASTDARQALIDASGGLANFTQNSNAFIQGFLLPAEKLAPAADAVARTFNQLGIAGVNTNAQFAALLKAQLALGNTQVVAQLLSVSGSFDQLTKAAADANQQLNALLNKQTFGTLVDYLRATMTGGSAATALAKANANLPSTIAAEQAATAAYAAQNAAAIKQANLLQQVVTTSATTTTGVSAVEVMLQKIIDAVMKVIEVIGKAIWDALAWLFDLVKPIWDAIWNAVVSVWEFIVKIWDILVAIQTLITDVVVTIWHAIWGVMLKVWDALTYLQSLVLDLPRGIADALKNLLVPGGAGGAGGAVKTVANIVTFGAAGAIANAFGWRDGGAFGAGGVHAFADGGAFTNGIFNTPTPFMFANGDSFAPGVMGEAGSEAVMPLSRRNGKLGVSVHGGAASGAGVADAMNTQSEKLDKLVVNSSAENAAMIGAIQRMERILDRWDRIGMPEVQAV